MILTVHLQHGWLTVMRQIPRHEMMLGCAGAREIGSASPAGSKCLETSLVYEPRTTFTVLVLRYPHLEGTVCKSSSSNLVNNTIK